MKLLLRWLLIAGVILLISYFLPGVTVTGFYAALITALVLGLVNAVVRPILHILTLPITVLTFGLFIFVVNALTFWFVSTVVKGFDVAGFVPAFLGALILSISAWVVDQLLA